MVVGIFLRSSVLQEPSCVSDSIVYIARFLQEPLRALRPRGLNLYLAVAVLCFP